LISDADLKLQSKPPFATQPWPLRGRIGLNERRRFDMVLVTHMRSPLKEPGLGRSRRPVWTNITVAATGQASVSGNALVPKTPEAFTYDADGNPTSDSLWTNVWDAENRLISMQSVAGVPAGAKLKVDFAYDQQGRRVQKVVSSWNGSAYVPQYTNRFVYDGWNLVAILNSDFSLLTSFVWGVDLSGTMEGAGGVGGLLWMTVPSGTNAGTYFSAYDGNGNVMALVSAADGSVAARYEYGPFGELIQATGPMAKVNPFRFSTKYQDEETGLVYYGYRYYDPGTGRWLNRDPMGEAGGLNLYQYVYNSPLNYVDPDGLWGIQFGDFNIGWGDPNLAFDWDSWNDLGQGAAATADGLIPFFDPFKDKYDPCDPIFAYSYAGGEIAQNALLTAAGLRAAAWLGGTRLGHGLNHNPYLRIGPGRMPRNGPHPPSTGAPRISVGPQRPGVQNPHLDLRLWPFD
jgi:RHS repeat-associated protein